MLDETVVEKREVRRRRKKVPCEGGSLLLQSLSAHVVARVESVKLVEAATSCDDLVSCVIDWVMRCVGQSDYLMDLCDVNKRGVKDLSS